MMMLRSAHRKYSSTEGYTYPSRSMRKQYVSPITASAPDQIKKIRRQTSYTTKSPFPTYQHPTHLETQEVYDILTTTHQIDGPIVRRIPETTSNSAGTCGAVPNVIEAVIGTILSQNTSATNCTRAKSSLDTTFGRNNFQEIANSPKEKVVDAIRIGGLANRKASIIQGFLQTVKARHGCYSLQHLTGDPRNPNALKDEKVMEELVSYNGVGPKTASCVLLFCLGRDSFPVDTHIYRLSRLLGWVPIKADRILAQAHLNIRIPDNLKYGLHILMIQHGRTCKGCKKPEAKYSCVLKDYLQKRNETEAVVNDRLEDFQTETKTDI